MYRRDDPRLRRTLNQLSQNIESANETAQESLFTFGQNYINPCLSSIGQCWTECTGTCFPTREERLRRNRSRTRGRAELSFDFYDDWEEEENDSLLGWGNDGLDRLLGSGSYGTTSQPTRERGMNYGGKKGSHPNGRRRSTVHAHDGGDPTLIPSSSYFGFLSKLPFKVGGKGLRYKPSAADLTEHPGALRYNDLEEDPLIEESEDDAQERGKTHKRTRSGTHSSGHTTDSLSSRGDIFPSEDELDDAVPLDDEFAMVLERRTTGLSTDEASSGKTRGKRPSGSGSRVSMRTESSRSTRSKRRARGSSASVVEDVAPIPTLSDLKDEELRIEQEEEAIVQLKRNAAQKLAAERGLTADAPQSPTQQRSTQESGSDYEAKPALQFSPVTDAVKNQYPFPEYDVHAAPGGNAAEVLDAAPVEPAHALPETEHLSENHSHNTSPNFVPARLPHFDGNGAG